MMENVDGSCIYIFLTFGPLESANTLLCQGLFVACHCVF